MRGIAGKLVALAVAALLLSASAMAQDVLAPSGTPAHIPAANESFASYLTQNRSNITSALRKTHYPTGTDLAFQHRDRNGQSTRYTLADAVDLRMPFELAPGPSCNGSAETSGSGMAFLLIHGLTDSPYLLRNIGDDATISAQAAAKFYCDKAQVEGSRMLWYQSRFADSAPQRTGCAGMEVIRIPQRDDVLSYSHVSLSTPEKDPHYGIEGRYRNCKGYEGEELEYQACVEGDGEAAYAENNLPEDEYTKRYLRRGTFNPLYPAMVGALVCFVDRAEC